MAKLRKTILQEKQENLLKEIKAQMVYCDIPNIESLGKRLGMNRPVIYNRMQFRTAFDYNELSLLFEVLKFSPEQKLRVI